MSRLEIIWTGTDGSVWDLVAGSVGLTPAGIKGLGKPAPKDQARESALRHGQVLTGWKIPPRKVWLPLQFRGVAELDVSGVQRDFWSSMAIGERGTLTVTQPTGEVRSIGLRFQDDGGIAYDLDPHVLSRPFGITFIADDPWWQGETIEFAYQFTPGTDDFFGYGAGATPFVISATVGGDSQNITNPGDVAAWVEWEVTGPATSFRLGVDGHYLGGIISIPTGSLIIETDPLRQLALLNGVRVTRQLNEIDWAPIPKGATLPVDITVAGTGLVFARLTPRYERAF